MTREPDPRSDRPEAQVKGDGTGKWLLGALGLLGIVAGVLSQRKWAGSKVAPMEAPPVPSFPPPAQKGHETRDANASWIFGVVGFLLIFGLSIHFILAGLLSSLNATAPPRDRWRPVPRTTGSMPSGAAAFPRLQVSAPADLETFRAREEAELNSYGWINKSSGVVRLPIDQAMELLLKKGLPVRAGANGTQTGPSTYQLLQQRPEHREPEIKGQP